jgi:hypothetical protein
MKTAQDGYEQRFDVEAAVAPGTMLAWGSNFSGQLGDGTTTDRTSAAPVPALTGISAIAAGKQSHPGGAVQWHSSGLGQQSLRAAG